MTNQFDPYHAWLGIPPESQPPNHYDLLGIPRFEENTDVIQSAADRQMMHLRTFQTGSHADWSQRLLNEVAAARLCLLNPQKKAAYDRQLRNRLEVTSQVQATEGPTDRARSSSKVALIVAAIAVGVLLLGRIIIPKPPEAARRPEAGDRKPVSPIQVPPVPRVPPSHAAPKKDAPVAPDSERSKEPPEAPDADLAAGGASKEDLQSDPGVQAGQETLPKTEDLAKPRAPPASALPARDQPVEPKRQPEDLQAAAAAEAEYTAALRPVEATVAAWDFPGALAALAKIQFDQDDLTARLVTRRDEIQRMAALKARMTAQINAADPPLEKMDLLIRGINGKVVRADEQGITAELGRGKTETYAWHDLGTKATARLLTLVVDRKNADDWLSAGVFALTFGDTQAAEKSLTKAESLGVDIGPYLGPLAAEMFALARHLLEEHKFNAADAVLADLEAKFADNSWFASHKAAFEAARAEAKAGTAEGDAESLYSQAAKLYQQRSYFDLKPLVNELKARHPDSKPVTETDRKPSFAEMEAAAASVGERVTVSKDGQGDFAAIQQAIDAAPANSLIEIQDLGPYNESLSIPAEKIGLTLRGKEGVFPIVTSTGPNRDFHTLVSVSALRCTLERLVLAHTAAGGHNPVCLSVKGGGKELSVRSCVLAGGYHVLFGAKGVTPQVEGCVLVGFSGYILGGLHLKNSLWIGRPERLDEPSKFENVLFTRLIGVDAPCEFRSCTLAEPLSLRGEPNVLADCVLHSVTSAKKDTRLQHCAGFGRRLPFSGLGTVDPSCLAVASPQFVNPDGLDYRLMPTSLCRGKASDGGDLGVRYTPKLVQMFQLALTLRSKGILKF